MGHTHIFRMKTDKLFCLCPEVPLQVCLPGSSNVWLSRTDRIQTEILCHFLAVPGLPYKREICVRFVWGLVPQEDCTEVLSYYPHIDKSIFHSFIFVLKNIPIVNALLAWRMTFLKYSNVWGSRFLNFLRSTSNYHNYFKISIFLLGSKLLIYYR